jgi:hypothetical protein
MGWDDHSKPPTDVCPEYYCFNWVSPDGMNQMSGRLYRSLVEALSTEEGWVSVTLFRTSSVLGLVLFVQTFFSTCHKA